MGSTTLFRDVFINPEQVVRFYACSGEVNSERLSVTFVSEICIKIISALKIFYIFTASYYICVLLQTTIV